MIGIDLVHIPRMEHFLAKYQEKALQRFLHKEEIALVHNHTTAAGFWAVKEALSKALGSGIGKDCSFFDIKIYKDDRGAPKVALSRKLIQTFNIIDVACSITHHGDYAVGVVTIEVSSPTHKIQEF